MKSKRLLRYVAIFITAYFLIGFLNDRYGRVGLASYYTDYGEITASGQRLTKYQLTAAHRKIPLGSKVRVTNLRNKRSVVVTINDRGPYVRDRIIDLSWEAARRIDILKKGLAPVVIKVE